MKFIDSNGTSVDCWADDIAGVVFYSNKEQYVYKPRFDTFLVTGNHAK